MARRAGRRAAAGDRHVLGDAEVGKQSEILHHETDLAPLRGQCGHVAAADQHAPGIGPVEAGDGLQRDRLAGAVRPQDDKRLAARQREIEFFQAKGAERERERLDGNGGADAGNHRFSGGGAALGERAQQHEQSQRDDQQQHRRAGGLIEPEAQEQLVDLHRRRHRVIDQDNDGAEFADRAGVSERDAGHDAAPRQRHGDAQKRPPRAEPERARDLLQPWVHGFEADARGVDRVGRRDEQHRHHDSGDGAPEFETDHRLQRFAQHALAAEHHQERDAGDGVRHGERQVDQRGDDTLAGKRGTRQPVGERHADQSGQRRGQKGPFQAEPDRVAHVGHARDFGKARAGLRERERDQRDDQKGDQNAAEEPARQIKAARPAGSAAPPPVLCRACRHGMQRRCGRSAGHDPGQG